MAETTVGNSLEASFEAVYQGLNEAQRAAVDQVDGPMLVIAGPGTGKTQLLGARVAQILRTTDTPAQNILCLTFTESGAANMRDRLVRFVGQTGYDVQISTYHAFGGDIISRFPQYFQETRLQRPIDELGKRQILRTIVEGLSYTNPLKQARHHLGDLIGTISEVKRALLKPDVIRAMAAENTQSMLAANQQLKGIFEGFGRMPGYAKARPLFEQLLAALEQAIPAQPVHAEFGALCQLAHDELQVALNGAAETAKTTLITAWKNKWLAKDSDNNFLLAGTLENARLLALADVLEQYQSALELSGLYDFDDMILRAVEALETHNDLRFTLQEQYLYILLDEFQDTNAAQLKLVELLTNNPVQEGRPNVMAVGDDDQAIYAFQGAQYSNMLDFLELYRDVQIINLTENYRSHADILGAAERISNQIAERLQPNGKPINKALTAKSIKLPSTAAIERADFASDAAQYDYIARSVKALIAAGTRPQDIAVLAPKHKQLEPLVVYLNSLDIPVRYEKRENILEAPVVRQLIVMSRLVVALKQNNQSLADSLWPEVLSYPYWQLPTSQIWQLSWQVNDDRSHWSKALLQAGDGFKVPALLLLTLAHEVESQTLETMLDCLIGNQRVTTNEASLPVVTAPLRDYYLNQQVQDSHPARFYETLSHLTVLRAKLREYQTSSESALTLHDFLAFVDLYEDADERLVSTSPYNQKADAVQLMTVFKAKGLEFDHVFLPSCFDEVWGSKARSNSNKLTLPANLAPIRHAGSSEDERLRLLFVALTRARFGLHLLSYGQEYTGKQTTRLKYFDEREQPGGEYTIDILPPQFQTIHHSDQEVPSLQLLELGWHKPHLEGLLQSNLRDLLEDRLSRYRLSPTHLNSFLDLEYAGPLRFFFNQLLRFPEAPGIDGQFGNAIHETLEWVQQQLNQNGQLPALTQITEVFGRRMLGTQLTEAQRSVQRERGESALKAYFAKRQHIFKPGDDAEVNLRSDNVHVDDVLLTGKIDRLEIDRANKTITVVDYKTGKSYNRWENDTRLHKYRHQLCAYKLLIEHSVRYQGYTVETGRLEFIEPDNSGAIHALELTFKDDEMAELKQLLHAVWQHIMMLDFPDVSAYTASLAGVREFERDLIAEANE